MKATKLTLLSISVIAISAIVLSPQANAQLAAPLFEEDVLVGDEIGEADILDIGLGDLNGIGDEDVAFSPILAADVEKMPSDPDCNPKPTNKTDAAKRCIYVPGGGTPTGYDYCYVTPSNKDMKKHYANCKKNGYTVCNYKNGTSAKKKCAPKKKPPQKKTRPGSGNGDKTVPVSGVPVSVVVD